MGKTLHEDVSNTVLRRMKESGFDFARVHPIEFYAIFPDEVSARSDGSWNLQVSKVMFATRAGIGDFEQGLEDLVEPLGGVLDGWGVTQELAAAKSD